MEVHSDRYVDVDVAGSTGQPESFNPCAISVMVKISVGTYKWFSYVLVCTDMGQGLPITFKRLAS